MVSVSGWWRVWGIVVFCAGVANMSRAQTFTTVASFDGKNGGDPGAISQGSDGNFYGTASGGGANDEGTVFKITRDGQITRLHSFCQLSQCADGRIPVGPLVQGTTGLFYGATQSGGDSGANGVGTVFEITSTGKLTTLHNFEYNSAGESPGAGLIQAANGNFYGTASGGGNGGTVFEITAAGKFTSLYGFCTLPNCADGERPEASLLQGSDGNFYGTAALGGAGSECSTSLFLNGCGTVFKITPAGKLTTLYSFCSLPNCADGNAPESSLVQDADGNFYGTTAEGGANCSPYGCGTVFEITPAGKLTTLYSFCALANCADGDLASAPLLRATDGNFYGTTSYGGTGSGGHGTIFQITPNGTLTTLYNFCSLPNCTDGDLGSAGLLQATNGIIYGTANAGGTGNDGIFFSLDMGLAPFVSFIRNPAKVGQQFGILGYGLTGTTSVSLNGIATTFKAESDTLLVATVPTAATSGYVTVTTPGGTLTSNVPFRVIP